MITVNIRELTHNFSKYLKEVKIGGRIILTERNKAVAEFIPYNAKPVYPGWKRSINKVTVNGEPLSQTVIRSRDES